MNKIALITDTHFGVRNEGKTFLQLHADFLQTFFQYTKDNNIKEIWHLGDFFDNRKYISSGLLHWVREHWLKPVQEQNITVRIIVGNHDTKFKSTNTPNSVTEYLGDKTNHFVVDDEIFVHKFANNSVAFVPWISPQNEQSLLNQLQQNSYDLVLGHLDILGMLMQAGSISEHGLDKEFFKHHKKVLSGHYHKKSTSANISYLGNPIPTSWAEAQDVHGFHTIDENLKLRFIQYEANIYQKIIIDTNDKIETEYNGSKFVRLIIKNKNEFHFQNYLEYLRQFDIVQLSIVDDTTENNINAEYVINEEELRDDLLTMVKRHIKTNDGIQEQYKDKLQELMEDLYEQAQKDIN